MVISAQSFSALKIAPSGNEPRVLKVVFHISYTIRNVAVTILFVNLVILLG